MLKYINIISFCEIIIFILSFIIFCNIIKTYTIDYALLYSFYLVICSLFVGSTIIVLYRLQITKFERKYFKLFGDYPSYFLKDKYKKSYYLESYSNFRFRQQNLDLITEIYKKEEKDDFCENFWNKIISIGFNLCCSFCCFTKCICCGISNIFNHNVVMSLNFRDKDIFILITKYTKKLDELLKQTKNNEWKLNEIYESLENKQEIIDTIVKNRLEIEQKIKEEPLIIINELSKIYQKEKMNLKIFENLEKERYKIEDINEKNYNEINICKEKIETLYKYYAKNNVIE